MAKSMTAAEILKSLEESIHKRMKTMSTPMIKIPTKLAASCCNGNNGSRWVVDKSQWECTDCGTPQSNDPSYLYSPGSTVVTPTKDTMVGILTPASTLKQCFHEYKTYTGLSETYEYCVKCDQKRST